MKTQAPLLILLSIAILFANKNVLAKETMLPHSIIVITSDKKPINNSDDIKYRLDKAGGTLSIYNLDAVQSFENLFSQHLPANEESARVYFEQEMKKYGVLKFEQKIIQAYQGLFTALVYNVDRYPVVIFNKTAAVYGITDLNVALKTYQQWRQTSNE